MANQNQPQDKTESTPATPPSAAGTGSDHGQAHAQDVVDNETDKGYSGTTTDTGDYSVAGSVAGENKPDEGKGTP